MLLTEQQIAELAAQNQQLRDALKSIQRYGLDTLSGRTDGPDDREWQRAGVNELTKRARVALSLSNLATPVLNKIKAEAYRELVSVFRNEGRDEVFVDRIEDEADALEKENPHD